MLAVPPESWALSAFFSFNGDFKIQGRPLHLSLDFEASCEQTGEAVWDAAIVLAKVLEWRPSLLRPVVRANEEQLCPCVLELGSGTGVVGLAAALLGANVILSDLPVVRKAAERNIQLNSADMTAAGGCASFNAFDWAQLDSLTHQHFDIVLATDVVWREEQAMVFAHAARHVLQMCACPMILARSDRTCVESAKLALFKAMAAAQLVVEDLGPTLGDSWWENVDLPDTGRNYARHGVIQIWRVSLGDAEP